jgi:hypothetical protein
VGSHSAFQLYPLQQFLDTSKRFPFQHFLHQDNHFLYQNWFKLQFLKWLNLSYTPLAYRTLTVCLWLEVQTSYLTYWHLILVSVLFPSLLDFWLIQCDWTNYLHPPTFCQHHDFWLLIFQATISKCLDKWLKEEFGLLLSSTPSCFDQNLLRRFYHSVWSLSRILI